MERIPGLIVIIWVVAEGYSRYQNVDGVSSSAG
jgi:hypothetical protein